MKIANYGSIAIIFLISAMLTGCPGRGDRLEPYETTVVTSEHHAICFEVLNAKDYRVGSLFISLHNTPPKERYYVHQPYLPIKEGRFCISPEFYSFPTEGQYVIGYVLVSKSDRYWPRRVAAGISFTNGVPHLISLDGDR